ncbi:MAG TPA: hypothetical protein DCL54_11365 [Alphaproteobacteria bacterium]|nr:hypothetical protein [Alphaproteobacteria bacterium]HAJ47165.1 hypothetical protein [Alphaproteobacteria bacterium]
MDRAKSGVLGALITVALLCALFFGVRYVMTEGGFKAPQLETFGGTPLTALVCFFLLPLLFAGIRDMRPSDVGLNWHRAGSQMWTALIAALIVFPATFLFPVLTRLNTSAFEWTGAAILAGGFFAMGLLAVRVTPALHAEAPEGAGWGGLAGFAVLFGAGLLAMHLLHPVSPVAARLIGVVVFVAIMEEFFFRGYVQSRLNDAFGRPFKVLGTEFGAGVVIASILFGLFHPLSDEAMRWPWALWTAAFGLILGLIREKTGSILAPGLIHGLIILPTAFAG